MSRPTPTPGRFAEEADLAALPRVGLDDPFPFVCAGCGDCCRARRDIVLSGLDLYRLARRLRLPPAPVAEAFCRETAGLLPGLCLKPSRRTGNCPFFEANACTVHEARPLACALYPLGQEIGREGQVRYYFQNTGCGEAPDGTVLADYLAAQGVAGREKCDVLWAVRCMALEEEAPGWEAAMGPVVLRRFQAKLAEALYERYDTARPWPEQFLENLAWLAGQRARLEEMQQRIYRKNR